MLPRFRHILVPLDFTSKNQAALDIAFDFAVREQAVVSLLHVIETIHGPQDPEDPELRDFYGRLNHNAESELDSKAQRFMAAGVRVNQRVRFGSRPTEIVRYASEHTVDLIIMSSHAVDRLHPATSLATVSYQVSVLCESPIMLVKPHPPKSPLTP